VSFDPRRLYRGVISQQGRVTLEADWNEANAIAAAENRADLIDVIGPSGTPDDGYRISPATNGDLTIQHGTLYVGGERMVLDTDLDYAAQPDWVDTAVDPLWVPPAVPTGNGTELVYLLLREQEVGAVEDPALLDIALGGPDTSARRRIVQRVVRRPTKAQTCPAGLSDLEQLWATEGLQFDPATMRLESTAKLQVSFSQPLGPATPCEPVAQGGYLGAENQLIRVQVARVDAGIPTLVWGYDNAFFLYRIAGFVVDEAGGTTTLTLESAPVDTYHQPDKGQAVEVLQAAARIGTANVDYIAAPTGIVTTLASAYEPDSMQVVIATALTAPTTVSPLLFLRVWQDTITVTGPGAVALGDTGVEVTLTASSGAFHIGDYWTFAVRPRTPAGAPPVYPARILDAPQPPDGPLEWACELGLVDWEKGSPTVTDCRQHFDNLVTLTGEKEGCCCTVDVSPADVDGGAKLQALIDRYARQGPTTICLGSGTYTLPAPLVIGAAHAGLTIQGCAKGVVLEAAEGPPETFLLGLILLEKPTDFTLRGLELSVPLVPFSFGAGALAGVPQERQPLLEAYGKELALSIGVYALGGAGVTFEDCTFSFAASGNASIFAAGVFATRAVQGLEIVDCTFTAPEVAAAPFSALARAAEAEPPYQVRFGYLQVPTRSQDVVYGPIDVAVNDANVIDQPAATLSRRAATAAAKKAALAAAAAAAAATKIGVPSLMDAIIERNLFDGLTVPVLVMGQVGTVRIDDNTVRSCYGGFWVVTAGTTDMLAMLDRVGAGSNEVWAYLVPSRLTALADPVLLFASVLGRILPLTPPSAAPTSTVGAIALPTATALTAAEGLFTRLYALQAVAAANAATAAGPEAAPAAPPAAAKVVVTELPAQLSDAFKAPDYVAAADLVPEADPGTALTARLDLSGNEIDAVLASADSGPGLLVVALDRTSASSLICTGNRIRSRVVQGATVSLWALVGCTITGNIVSNEIANAKDDLSIVLEPQIIGNVAAVAVTGNVLVGPVHLPIRAALAAPLNTWNGLNTVMQYVSPS